MDDIFSIEPLQGTIWPNSFAEVTVHFHPNLAVPVQKTVFCQVSGRETRLPLTLNVYIYILTIFRAKDLALRLDFPMMFLMSKTCL